MNSKAKHVGVLGSGSFGTAIANLLAHNVDVLLYTRNDENIRHINEHHEHQGISLSPRITATNDLELITKKCTLIFPVVPSSSFRGLIRKIAPFLHPYHVLIHGTKGLDIRDLDIDHLNEVHLRRKDVSTMSEIILEESVVVRVGCLSGPNLASEILEGQPTATVIGSKFNEVIQHGKSVLASHQFHVFGSSDILGAELSGALKNIVAIGSGILTGQGLGKNIQAMLITRGWMEMVYFGRALNSSTEAFFGSAGIGDLVATATSKKSRNYTFGYRIGQGEKYEDIMASLPELAEGVRTLRIAYQLAKEHKLHVPITRALHQIVFDDLNFKDALEYLMKYPYDVDVDFLK